VLAAIGLEALLRGFGITLPTGSPVFELRTVLVGLAVGVGVTVVASIGPARNAVRIPPIAALSDQSSAGDVSLRRRFIWGACVALAGVALLAVGLAKPVIALVGVGAVGIFVGVAMLSRRLPARSRAWSAVRWPAGCRAGSAGRTPCAVPAHGPDRLCPHGRPRPGRRDVGVRCLAVQVGHGQRG